MNLSVEKEREKRFQIYDDLYNMIIPERMPIEIMLFTQFFTSYKNINVFEAQYNMSLVEESINELSDILPTDTLITVPAYAALRTPKIYQMLKSTAFVMGDKGFVQHPEVVGLHEKYYDELIADPKACIYERVIPEVYKALNPNDPINSFRNYYIAMAAKNHDESIMFRILQKISERKGYYLPPAGCNSRSEAPFDFLADLLRSFTDICKDIKRQPSKVADACDALLPLMLKWGIPANISPHGFVGMPLHMPPFLRNKDYEKLWYPTYKKMLDTYAAYGIRTKPFFESDWSRYHDSIMELPAGTYIHFEKSDIQCVKDTFGKKHLILSNFPVSEVMYGNKNECIDLTKKMLDIIMPGGGAVFGFDKILLDYSDKILENLVAITTTIKEYGQYDNPGEQSIVKPLNPENYTKDPHYNDFIESKYSFDWDSFKKEFPYSTDNLKDEYQKYDEAMMFEILGLLW